MELIVSKLGDINARSYASTKTGQVHLLTLLYKAEMTSVRPSVCLSDRHVDSSVVYAWIDVVLGTM